MKNPLHSPAATSLGLLLMRAPLGVYFALAGIHKFQGGVSNFVAGSMKSVPPFMPEVLGKAYLYCLPAAEVVVGVCLVLGLFSRLIGCIATLMLISFTIAVTGVAGQGGAPFHPNLIFIGIALAVMLAGPGGYAVDNLQFKKASRA